MKQIGFLGVFLVLVFLLIDKGDMIVARASAALDGLSEPHALEASTFHETRLSLPVYQPVLDYAADPQQFDLFTFEHDGTSHAYFARIPAESGNSFTRSTVTVLLHDADRTGADMVDMWDAVRGADVLIAPQSAGVGDWSLEDADFFVALMRNLRSQHDVRADRYFLFGHGSGAEHAQWLASQRGVDWTAVATFGGAISADRLAYSLGIPTRLYLGGSDPMITKSAARRTGRTLAELGSPTDLVVIPDQTGWYFDMGETLNPEIMSWFIDVATEAKNNHVPTFSSQSGGTTICWMFCGS